jgi:hypothetical protein
VVTTAARLAGLVLANIVLAGCAAHSFPLDNQFIGPVPSCAGPGALTPCPQRDVVQLFSDMNGTLYPSGWQGRFQPRMSRKRPGEGRWLAGNLLAQSAGNRKFRDLIARDTGRQLNAVHAFAQGHQRIFILVHGFNASMDDARPDYELVENTLDLKAGDGVIRFHWDGLIGSGVGAVKNWFKVANSSQLVGARGLRGVLNAVEGRDVYLISHSRGASVVLSALGNPVHNPKFLRKTKIRAALWGTSFRALTSPAPLQERSNRLHVLMLAPAIGRIDFCDARAQPKSFKDFVCPRFRPLGKQVASFAYTVNSDDPVLGKSILSSRALTPTGFGYLAAVGEELAAEYPMMKPYVLTPPQGFHAFKDYAAHPLFMKMIEDAGIRSAAPVPEQSAPLIVKPSKALPSAAFEENSP